MRCQIETVNLGEQFVKGTNLLFDTSTFWRFSFHLQSVFNSVFYFSLLSFHLIDLFSLCLQFLSSSIKMERAGFVCSMCYGGYVVWEGDGEGLCLAFLVVAHIVCTRATNRAHDDLKSKNKCLLRPQTEPT
jgi:hypothetical protein